MMLNNQYDFTSQTDDAPEGFAGYHQLYSSGTDADRGTGGFEARVTVISYRQLAITDRHLAGVRHSRGALRVRRDGFNHVNMQLVLDGAMLGGPLGDERPVRPGEIIFFDMTRPQRTIIGQTRLIALSLPRQAMERHCPISSALHGAVLPVAAGGLLRDLMRSLVRHAPVLAAQASTSAVDAVASFAAAALGGLPDRGPGRLDKRFAGQVRFDRICQHIANHLSDPRLTPEGTAAALGMSRSTLTRCMAPAGGFNAVLLSMRLDRMRSELRRSDPAETIASIAFRLGFTSISHLTRSFGAQFGLPPRAWRDQNNATVRKTTDRPGTLDYLINNLV